MFDKILKRNLHSSLVSIVINIILLFFSFQSVLQQASSVMNSGSSDDHLLTTLQEHYTMAGMYAHHYQPFD